MQSSPNAAPALLAIFPILCILFFALLALLASAFWIWMIVDCATKEPSEGNDKVVWLLIIVFFNTLGAILYFLIRRPERIRQLGI